MRFSFGFSVALIAGFLTINSARVSAQQAGGFVVDLPDVDNFFALGIGVLPDYEGSDDFTIGIGPAALLKPWDNERSIRLLATELTLNVLNHRNWSFGPVANYRFKRSDVDDDVVKQFVDVNAALELGASLGWSWISDGDPRNRFTTSMQLLQDVTGNHEGFLASGSARYFLPVSLPVTLSAGAAVTYASSDYMDTYFGVSAVDSARSGLTQFSAGGGIRDIRFPLMAIFSLSPKWHISAGGIVKILLDDAADSPIVDDRGDATQIIAGIGLAYAW